MRNYRVFLIPFLFFVAICVPCSGQNALSKQEIKNLIKSGVTSGEIQVLVDNYGVTFVVDENTLQELETAGVNNQLMKQIIVSSIENQKRHLTGVNGFKDLIWAYQRALSIDPIDASLHR